MHVNASVNTTQSPFYTDWYFAPHLQKAGYAVGIFGKHLNNGYVLNNPMCPPAGVERWFANGGGSYYSPSFFSAAPGELAANLRFDNCTYNNGSCYSTSVIANTTIAWIHEVSEGRESAPALLAHMESDLS
jgi:hypothetical protein